MWVAINGQSSVVTTLVNAGAELDIPDDKNLTALMRAAWSGHLSIVNQLIAAGADLIGVSTMAFLQSSTPTVKDIRASSKVSKLP